ncbi:hypothetical protein QAD02_024037 [Eretmocerus hayati]|uniref:Uncharacterized protein n=1 Tax=Eretmocerus hayati TaxID=131215 RepID=A0ACC2Q109_9HYME|nr:hypothetical protein QAD02_024037 [Eretmocerus hayati]
MVSPRILIVNYHSISARKKIKSDHERKRPRRQVSFPFPFEDCSKQHSSSTADAKLDSFGLPSLPRNLRKPPTRHDGKVKTLLFRRKGISLLSGNSYGVRLCSVLREI